MTPTSTPADAAYITLRVTLGRQPCGVLSAAGSVWVSLYGEDRVVRLDPATGAVRGSTPTGKAPCGLASGAGSIWVENYNSDSVTRVDATTGAVQATIGVGSSPYDVTFADGAAWVTDYASSTVSRIDAKANARTAIPVGQLPVGIAPTTGAVWAASSLGEIARIDTRTAKVVATVKVGSEAGWTASTPDMLWVAAGPNGEIARIDPRTNAVVGRATIGAKALDGDVVGDLVWFPTKGGAIYPLDPRTDAVGPALTRTTGNPFVVAGHEGAVWAVDYVGTDVVRIDPTRR